MARPEQLGPSGAEQAGHIGALDREHKDAAARPGGGGAVQPRPLAQQRCTSIERRVGEPGPQVRSPSEHEPGAGREEGVRLSHGALPRGRDRRRRPRTAAVQAAAGDEVPERSGQHPQLAG